MDPDGREDYSIIKMGEYKLKNTELFDYLINRVTYSGLMGKKYSTDSNAPYVCTTFVDEVLGELASNIVENFIDNSKKDE